MRTVTPNRTGDIGGHAFTKGQPIQLPDDLAEALVDRGYATGEQPQPKGKGKKW